MGVAFVANYAYIQKKNPGCADQQCELLRSTLRWIAIASVVLLGVEFVVTPVLLAFIGKWYSTGCCQCQVDRWPHGLHFLDAHGFGSLWVQVCSVSSCIKTHRALAAKRSWDTWLMQHFSWFWSQK